VRAPTRIRIPSFVVPLLAGGLMLASAVCASSGTPGIAVSSGTPVTFEAPGGVRLAGRLFGSSSDPAGVVLAHMLPSDQSAWFDFAANLSGQGYRVLTFNLRGVCPGGVAGCSKGHRDPTAAPADIRAATAFLRSKGALRVGLVGAGVGGTAALVAASRPSSAFGAVVTLSAQPSMDGVVAGPDVLQTVDAAKLFVAGALDTGGAKAAQYFYDDSLQPKRVDLLTTADYGTDLLSGNQSEQTRNAVIGWLNQYVPPTQPTA
jgi:pimeloyl-ACP methyl ester carboxylesterase